uniref:Uncharacterized protein n=1 Tax=Babesia bovis TaxID=5865 RepID=S6B7I0_BABBO|nr:conserved hypothetical protein [Babesia bovis]
MHSSHSKISDSDGDIPLFDFQQPDRTCSIDCVDTCQSALGGKNQCMAEGVDGTTCAPFHDATNMECDANMKPCVMPRVDATQKYEIQGSTRDNPQPDRFTILGNNFNNCVSLLLTIERQSCNKLYVNNNITMTRQALSPDYKVERTTDALIFTNVKVYMPGIYRVCLYQQYERPTARFSMFAMLTGWLNFFKPASDDNPVRTVYSIDAGLLFVH